MINKKIKILVFSLFTLAVPAVIIPTVVSCSNNSGFVANLKKDDLFTYATTNSFVQSVLPQETFNSLKTGTNMFRWKQPNYNIINNRELCSKSQTRRQSNYYKLNFKFFKC